WVDTPGNRLRADEKTAHVAKEYIVNLDLPQEDRWTEVGQEYADKAWMLVQYLRSNLPRGWLKPMEKIAGELLPFFRDYGGEMKGYAAALNITEGDVVMINLIYQLEHLGLSCDSWNTTGPSHTCDLPPDDAIGPFQPFADEEEEYEREINEPGPCTSFVVSDPAGKIWHGRNMDWNLVDSLKQFIINVKYQKGGKTVFHGTTAVGFVGILHAVKAGMFGWSMDARRKGGNIPINLLKMALDGDTRTPEQHARYVFENYDDYDSAVEAMGNWPIVNPVYYIMSGITYPQGCVLARDRKGVVHNYQMQDEVASPGGNVQKDFWVGITNYDLEHHPLPADDRATPMTENLNALEGQQFGDDEIWGILETWPTFNMHTDITAVIDVASGAYDVVVW
ncbi:unnamed protein product, partial [Ectocarpus fasciculatus]